MTGERQAAPLGAALEELIEAGVITRASDIAQPEPTQEQTQEPSARRGTHEQRTIEVRTKVAHRGYVWTITATTTLANWGQLVDRLVEIGAKPAE